MLLLLPVPLPRWQSFQGSRRAGLPDLFACPPALPIVSLYRSRLRIRGQCRCWCSCWPHPRMPHARQRLQVGSLQPGPFCRSGAPCRILLHAQLSDIACPAEVHLCNPTAAHHRLTAVLPRVYCCSAVEPGVPQQPQPQGDSARRRHPPAGQAAGGEHCCYCCHCCCYCRRHCWQCRNTAAAAAAAASHLLFNANPPHRPLLPSLPQPGNGEGTRQEAARALSDLSCNNDVSQGCQMVDEGAVPLLVAMMQVGGVNGGCSGRLLAVVDSPRGLGCCLPP